MPKNNTPNPHRAQALAALDSIKALPPHVQSQLMRLKPAVNQKTLTKMMLGFMEGCLFSNDGVPNFSLDDFTIALGAALLQMGNNNQMGPSLLQTMVHELQDNINSQVPG